MVWHYLCLMAAIVPLSRTASSNRRSRVRHRAHIPAYATLGAASASGMLDLYEVLDISESGVALQCSLPVALDQVIDLRLDLAEAPELIVTTSRAVRLDAGRVAFHFLDLSNSAARQLKDWLFLNTLSAADDAQAASLSQESLHKTALPQNYTDILSATSAVQREVEALGSDLQAILSLLASRCRSLLRATGAAIALEGKDPGSMICRASSGPGAPPVGLAMQIGSGFSGECVRDGKLLRCDDTEIDPRVDIQTCRALGIRSMLAAPLRIGENTIGLLEVFSQRAHGFTDGDTAVLQRFAEMILTAFNRTLREYSPVPEPPVSDPQFPSLPGNVLFVDSPRDKSEKNAPVSDDNPGGVRLPRTHLLLLVAAAATIALALGFSLAPWIQDQLHSRHIGEPKVLASSTRPTEATESSSTLGSDSANLAQLRQLAAHGDASAENALGLLYIAGDEKQNVKPDETLAAQWFIKAAEHGNVPAQSKLGSLYWSGRGVQKDDNRAYFWTVLARANGNDASRVLAPFIATRLTSPQRAAIEQEAEQWLLGRESANNSHQ